MVAEDSHVKGGGGIVFYKNVYEIRMRLSFFVSRCDRQQDAVYVVELR